MTGSIGCDLSNAWTCDFSSAHSTMAFSGGSIYNPTISVIFASSCGSVENLNDSVRCGWIPQFRQIEAISLWLTPTRLASSRLDQCVKPDSSGGGVNVSATTIASSTVGGRPERS